MVEHLLCTQRAGGSIPFVSTNCIHHYLHNCQIMKFFIKLLKAIKNSALNLVLYHDGIEHAGYLSFLILFSLFPFIIFFLSLTSVFGFSEFAVKFLSVIIDSVPGNIVQQRTQELLNNPPQSLMTIAILGSIWTASSFVEGLRTILNKIYNLTTPPSYLFRRMLSIVQFFLISIFLFCGMMLLVVVPIIVDRFNEIHLIMQQFSSISYHVRYILIFLCLFLSSSGLYYIIPNVKIKYSQVVPGSILTVCLWLCSAHLLSNYIKYYNQLNFLYGSIGNIILTLIFFYCNNLIFIYGAEFNYQISKQKG